MSSRPSPIRAFAKSHFGLMVIPCKRTICSLGFDRFYDILDERVFAESDLRTGWHVQSVPFPPVWLKSCFLLLLCMIYLPLRCGKILQNKKKQS